MGTRMLPVGKYRSQSGFAYLMLLASIVVIAILSQISTLLSSTLMQIDREAELLFRGLAYKNAIASYYNAGGKKKVYPENLDLLSKDPRFANKKHIRTLYSDPVSDDEWVSLEAIDGGVQGIASASSHKPLKQGNFPVGLDAFEKSESYSEWVFIYKPKKIKKKIKD